MRSSLPGGERASITRSAWPAWVWWLIGLTPPLMWAALVWYSQVDEPGFMALTEEDHVVENVQWVLGALAAVLGGRIAWRLGVRRRWGWALCYGVLALGLVWVAGEEISWGQRLVGFQTPAWVMERNQQEELNLHNLPEVRRFTDYWLDRAILFLIALSLFGWVLRKRWAARWRVALWIPHPVLLPAWVCAVSYEWLRYAYVWRYHAQVSPVVNRLHEARELFLAMGLAAFLVMVWQQIRQSPHGSV